MEKFGNKGKFEPVPGTDIGYGPSLRKKTPESQLEDLANKLDSEQREGLRNALRKIGINLKPK